MDRIYLWCIAIKYNISSKAVYELFNAIDIVKHYQFGHTFDIVQVAEGMMENINYDNNIEKKSLDYMRRLMILEKTKELLGNEVTIYINRPIGYNYNGIIYSQNYGYIKNIKALEDENLDAYVLGIEKEINVFTGKVIAIINRLDDKEDKLVICKIMKIIIVKKLKT